MENAKWSLKYQPVDSEDVERAEAILNGGQRKIQAIMERLRKTHLIGLF